MTINQAIEEMRRGSLVRHENFAAGTACSMDCNDNVFDPELGPMPLDKFLSEYNNFQDNWFIYA